MNDCLLGLVNLHASHELDWFVMLLGLVNLHASHELVGNYKFKVTPPNAMDIILLHRV
jgi:hypothetical protein